MPNIDLPDGAGDEVGRMWSLRPELGAAADLFNRTITDHMTISIREREAARIRIAHLNGCIPCSEARLDDMERWGLDDAFYDNVDDPADRVGYSERELLAIEFAERFDAGEAAFDGPFWDRLNAAYSSGELVELATFVAKCLGLGRINAVFGLTVSCPLVVRPGAATLASV